MLGKKHSKKTKYKIGKANSVALLGKIMSQSTKDKIREASLRNGNKPPILTGKDNPGWRGDKVGFHGVHDWVYKVLGAPKKCEHCSISEPDRMYHWANKHHTYRRRVRDWMRLCVPCHRKYDYKYNKK